MRFPHPFYPLLPYIRNFLASSTMRCTHNSCHIYLDTNEVKIYILIIKDSNNYNFSQLGCSVRREVRTCWLRRWRSLRICTAVHRISADAAFCLRDSSRDAKRHARFASVPYHLGDALSVRAGPTTVLPHHPNGGGGWWRSANHRPPPSISMRTPFSSSRPPDRPSSYSASLTIAGRTREAQCET